MRAELRMRCRPRRSNLRARQQPGQHQSTGGRERSTGGGGCPGAKRCSGKEAQPCGRWQQRLQQRGHGSVYLPPLHDGQIRH